jgi:hypothetical protein
MRHKITNLSEDDIIPVDPDVVEDVALLHAAAKILTARAIRTEDAHGVEECGEIAFKYHRKIRELIIEAFGDTPENLIGLSKKKKDDNEESK